MDFKTPEPSPYSSTCKISPVKSAIDFPEHPALPQSQRSSTPSSEIGATPPSSPHHILTWQSGSYSDSCFLDSPLYPELADVQWYGQEKAKPGTLV
ncbi:FERM domain-containing protein 4A [Myotis brandtii]|uniref:FERM domain-containing protein 4A n=1 Tax=Myotis brandtii TaxID=109478 RepID=S7PX69_MYOBR|nr:FERM domain-containing protein 4A [Myotis brandtii]